MKRITVTLTEDQLRACEMSLMDWSDRTDYNDKLEHDYNAFLRRLITKLQKARLV